MTDVRSRGAALALISFSTLLAMGLWFGVSAVAPEIAREWRLGESGIAWLTLSVQLGFVAGTLVSALLNLPDIVRPRHLMAICAAGGALVNVALALFVHTLGPAVALRFLTGACLAGVYPPAMKLIATWFREGRGFALGVVVGALTLGKASPYLVGAFGAASWRTNLAIASAVAAAGAVTIAAFVHEGPLALPNQPFDFAQVTQVVRNRGVRLANFGYFGHMWELYAMWTWAPVMIRASIKASGDASWLAETASFVVIGSGAAGCIVAGRLADRLGRTVIASGAMFVSGLCCLLIGLLYGRSPLLLLLIAAVWGTSVVADSAQFSACVTELADPRYIGTALTMQTCIGFLITTASIRLVPLLADRFGWRYAFASLAVGPALGIAAMLRLRALPESVSIAQGKR